MSHAPSQAVTLVQEEETQTPPRPLSEGTPETRELSLSARIRQNLELMKEAKQMGEGRAQRDSLGLRLLGRGGPHSPMAGWELGHGRLGVLTLL